LIAVYEWRAWNDFLLPSMFTSALRIPARIGDTASDVERQIEGVTFFAFHVDLTESSHVPLGRRAMVARLNRRDVRVVNGTLTNISKRQVQAACAARGLPSTTSTQSGPPNELVIVKSDLNYGGETESQLEPAERIVLKQALAEAMPIANPNYLVVPRRDVPPDVWRSPALVVEKFVSNRTNLFFRAYVFLTRLVISAAIDDGPIKRLHWGIPRRQFYFEDGAPVDAPSPAYSLDVLQVPPALVELIRVFCSEMRMDFGAIDVVMDDDGRCYVIDANTTPYWGRPDLREIVNFLASSDLSRR
jgi:hypothetical protein